MKKKIPLFKIVVEFRIKKNCTHSEVVKEADQPPLVLDDEGVEHLHVGKRYTHLMMKNR